MRTSAFLLFGLLCWQTAAPAQTINDNAEPDNGHIGEASRTGMIGADATTEKPTYAPPTASERWRQYFLSAYGPEAILRASASAGISQWNDTPKEWKQGSEAFGERFGNSLAKHVVRKTLEAGAAGVLHEDNRYVQSTETGLWNRTKHAVGSVFVARNAAGQEHFAYSRFGSAIASSFISRAWQPRSETASGDAAVNFGITMAVDIGWNVYKEFRPKRFGRRF